MVCYYQIQYKLPISKKLFKYKIIYYIKQDLCFISPDIFIFLNNIFTKLRQSSKLFEVIRLNYYLLSVHSFIACRIKETYCLSIVQHCGAPFTLVPFLYILVKSLLCSSFMASQLGGKKSRRRSRK